MTKIIGVRFRSGGRVYYFDPEDLELRNGMRVIVETSRGPECGRVVLGVREVGDERVTQPLRPVLRIATEKDLEREESNREKEKEAFRICRRKIEEHKLDMKLIKAEYTFDNKKVLFYFTADGRVDFRDLVKDLASVFRMRIELRQVGVRDETKMLGGIGICGRPLCCSTYLTDFAPVSIRMAKEQNLSLNPAKISGVCGRLMCCLKNEQETYEYLNKKLPGVGDIVEADDGRQGTVQSVNVLRQSVRVLIEDGDNKEIIEHPVTEIEIIQKRRKGKGKPVDKPQEKAENKGQGREKTKGKQADKEKNRPAGAAAPEKGESAPAEKEGKSRRRRSRRRGAKHGNAGTGQNAPERQDKAGQGSGAAPQQGGSAPEAE